MSSERGYDADYRLPRHAMPRRYELRVSPDFASRTFDGEVAIELEISEETAEIVLNAAEIEITGASLRAGDGTHTPLSVTLDAERERVCFGAPGPVAPGQYVVSCSFSAELGTQLRGFYVSSFTGSDGTEHLIASTHFEATDARRAFPCFDEPDMKAAFSITLDVPRRLFAVSNSPEAEVTELPGGRRRVRFSDTMAMSTYLVAYAVGPFEATEPALAGGVPVRVVVPEGRLHLTGFALEAAVHALGWFHDYFAIPYPAEKLDLVAIPDFAMGAMENLGCVTFREQDLLCNPEESSIPELARVAEVVEHELAHMWFGDLVTMRWWNGIWLNEAFATFMSVRCLDEYRPEWNRWPTFGIESDLALRVDGLHATRPIEFPVRAPDEADAMFDHLTYLKGGSVLRMLEQYLGPDVFREGVRRYLAAHAYGNTETTDLWDSIESVAPGVPVRAMLDTWIFQGGYPLVTASLNEGRAALSARPFSYLPEDERPRGAPPSAIGDGWLVPVFVEARPGPTRAVMLGPAPSGTDPVDCGAPEGLFVARAGGSGTYRLRYEGPLFDEVLAGLAMLQPLERFNLVSDSWACTLAGLGSLGDFLAIVRKLRDERDPNVFEIVASALRLVDIAAAAGSAEPAAAGFVREIGRPVLDSIGLGVGDDDGADVQRLRAILVGLLGTTGQDEDVVSYSREAFGRHRAGDAGALHRSLADVILDVVVAVGGREEFEEVRAGFRHPADPQSENRHLFALTFARDPELVAAVLTMTLGEIRAQDGHLVLRAMFRNRFAAAATWRFVTEHFEELSLRLPSHAMPAILGGAAQLVELDESGRPAFVDEVQRFVDGHDFGGRRRLVDQALEQQVVNARFVAGHRTLIGELLAKS